MMGDVADEQSSCDVAWLVADDRVLATVEVADSWRTRLRGVLGRETLDGAMVLVPARSVHTVGVRFSLDVAYCDSAMRVIDIVTMAPNRLGRPRPSARMVIEAPKGSFERWGVVVGDQLELRR